MRISSVLLILFLWVLLVPVSAFSQNTQANTSLESCFQYYDYGKIKTNLASEKGLYEKGETVNFFGTIENNNSFPITGAILYGQLKRRNTKDFDASGNYLVDTFKLSENLNFIRGEVKNINFSLPVLQIYPSGEYQMQYFIFTKDGVHYAGRPFLEEDTAGVSNFDIAGADQAVFFDPATLTVGGKNYEVRKMLDEFSGKMNIAVSLDGGTSTNARADYFVYKYDDTFESNLVDSGVADMTGGKLSYVFNPTSGGAYIFIARIDSPFKSIFRYRFAISTDEPGNMRVADFGMTNFPPGSQDRMYLCVHSDTKNPTKPTTIAISVSDSLGNVVEKATFTGSIGGMVSALSMPLEKVAGTTNFKINAQVVPEDSVGVVIPGGAGSSSSESIFIEKNFSCDSFSESVSDLSFEVESTTEDNNLAIQSVDGCGLKKSISTAIESVRIFKNGELVSEEYNVVPNEEGLKLSQLPAGEYTIEAQQGVKVASANFSISGTKNGNRAYVYVFAFLVTLFMAVLAYFLLKRKYRLK